MRVVGRGSGLTWIEDPPAGVCRRIVFDQHVILDENLSVFL